MIDESEDELIWDYAEMMSASKRASWRDYVMRATKALLGFIQDNGLARHLLWDQSQEIPLDLIVWNSELTDLGQMCVLPTLQKWLQKHDRGGKPEDVTILVDALKRVQASARK